MLVALSLQVTFQFFGTAPGEFSLPVQVLIAGGRRLRLDLLGSCEEPGFAEVHLPGAHRPGYDGNITLQPVALGDLNPPLQSITLWNSGSCSMKWAIDASDLTRLSNENWRYAPATSQPKRRVHIYGLAMLCCHKIMMSLLAATNVYVACWQWQI
jgi:hypothetical protein